MMGVSKEEVTEIAVKHVAGRKRNRFAAIGLCEEAMWDAPIVGFCRGDDPYYDFLKKDIGEFHWSPVEAFSLGRKNSGTVRAKDLCVVSIGLPQTRKTKESNAAAREEPALRWVVTRGEWESLIAEISQKIVMEIEKKGVKAVAIDHVKEFQREVSENYGMASSWSHRHAAFACGLGTFGHSDGLITRKGKAMRFTTILIEADIVPDVRQYEKHNEWCKFTKDGGCGACIKRCPAGAITREGHDKAKCSDFLDNVKEKTIKSGVLNPELIDLRFLYGCGLCQCGVPCQDGIPT